MALARLSGVCNVNGGMRIRHHHDIVFRHDSMHALHASLDRPNLQQSVSPILSTPHSVRTWGRLGRNRTERHSRMRSDLLGYHADNHEPHVLQHARRVFAVMGSLHIVERVGQVGHLHLFFYSVFDLFVQTIRGDGQFIDSNTDRIVNRITNSGEDRE